MDTTEDRIKTEHAVILREAQDCRVTTAAQYQDGAELMRVLYEAEKTVTGFFDPMKRAAHAAWRAVCDKENTYVKPLQAASLRVKGAMMTWKAQEDAKAAAEARRLQAIADADARKTREKLEAQAERAEAKGRDERAEQLREQAATVIAPTVMVPVAAPKVDGLSTRKTWKARVVDANAVPREWLVVDEAALNAFARSTKGLKRVSGVEFYEEESFTRRG